MNKYSYKYKNSYDDYNDDYNGYYNDYDNDYYNEYYDNNEYSSRKYYNKKDLYEEYENDDLNEYDDNEEITDNDISIDEDLAGYFTDARLYSMKTNDDSNTKKKPKKIIYKIDDKVIISMNKTTSKGQILFGPYEVNKKQMYQIELEDGQLIEADDKHLQYQ